MEENTEEAPKAERENPNLKPPWKKGDPSPNPKGRGKGVLSAKTVIGKWLKAREKGKNPITSKEIMLTQMDIIVLEQLKKARKGDTRAFEKLLDRLEGKAAQSVDVTTNGESINTIDVTVQD